MTSELIIGSLIVFGVGIFFFARIVPLAFLIPILLLRIVIPLSYFLYAFDVSSWGIVDDETYFLHAQKLLHEGFSLTEILFSEEVREYTRELSGSVHFGYTILNAVAMLLCGDSYAVPVFWNVAYSILLVRVLIALYRIVFPSSLYSSALAVFGLLHWDLIAWSSFVNVKDIFVALLTISTIYVFARLCNQFRVHDMALFCLLLLLFLPLRYYLPVLVLATAALWFSFSRTFLVTLGTLPLVILAASFFLPSSDHMMWELLFWENILRNVAHFLLTPIPWQIGKEYGFLLVPAICHVIFAPLALWGAWVMWKRAGLAQIPVWYVLLATLFYSLVPELSGPRHRVQLVPFLLLFQFLGIISLLGFDKRKENS